MTTIRLVSLRCVARVVSCERVPLRVPFECANALANATARKSIKSVKTRRSAAEIPRRSNRGNFPPSRFSSHFSTQGHGRKALIKPTAVGGLLIRSREPSAELAKRRKQIEFFDRREVIPRLSRIDSRSASVRKSFRVTARDVRGSRSFYAAHCKLSTGNDRSTLREISGRLSLCLRTRDIPPIGNRVPFSFLFFLRERSFAPTLGSSTNSSSTLDRRSIDARSSARVRLFDYRTIGGGRRKERVTIEK